MRSEIGNKPTKLHYPPMFLTGKLPRTEPIRTITFILCYQSMGIKLPKDIVKIIWEIIQPVAKRQIKSDDDCEGDFTFVEVTGTDPYVIFNDLRVLLKSSSVSIESWHGPTLPPLEIGKRSFILTGASRNTDISFHDCKVVESWNLRLVSIRYASVGTIKQYHPLTVIWSALNCTVQSNMNLQKDSSLIFAYLNDSISIAMNNLVRMIKISGNDFTAYIEECIKQKVITLDIPKEIKFKLDRAFYDNSGRPSPFKLWVEMNGVSQQIIRDQDTIA